MIPPNVVRQTDFQYWITRAKAALNRLGVTPHQVFDGDATTSNMEKALGVVQGVLADYKNGHHRVAAKPNGLDSGEHGGFWKWTKDHSVIVVGGLVVAAFGVGVAVGGRLASYDKDLESTRLLELLGQCKAPAEKTAKQSPPLELLAIARDYCGPIDAGAMPADAAPCVPSVSAQSVSGPVGSASASAPSQFANPATDQVVEIAHRVQSRLAYTSGWAGELGRGLTPDESTRNWTRAVFLSLVDLDADVSQLRRVTNYLDSVLGSDGPTEAIGYGRDWMTDHDFHELVRSKLSWLRQVAIPALDKTVDDAQRHHQQLPQAEIAGTAPLPASLVVVRAQGHPTVWLTSRTALAQEADLLERRLASGQ